MLKNFLKLLQFRSERLYRFGSVDRPYIIPTRIGIYVALFCFSFLGVAYLYQNNLVYLYVFLTFSVYVSAMVACNRNLKSLSLISASVAPYFADLQGVARVLIGKKGKHQVRTGKVFFKPDLGTEIEILGEGSDHYYDVTLPISTRGHHELPRAVLETKFPFGFFRSWKFGKASCSYWVYPARTGVLDFPAAASEDGSEGESQKMGKDEEFIGHRDWESSMSFRRIDWKVKAKTGKLMVQQFDGGEQGPIVLPWSATNFLNDFEKKISQMSLWVDRAGNSGRQFMLRTSKWNSGWGRGLDHAHRCWKFLAELKSEDV